jgi:hypothetical protein
LNYNPKGNDHTKQGQHDMNRIDKLKNDVYSFEELITLEKNATQLRDSETLRLIEMSRASKTAKGEKPKAVVDEDGRPLTRRARREEKRDR